MLPSKDELRRKHEVFRIRGESDEEHNTRFEKVYRAWVHEEIGDTGSLIAAVIILLAFAAAAAILAGSF